MKKILLLLCVVIITAGLPAQRKTVRAYAEPARAKGQTSVLQLACAPMDTVRIGFVGLGQRGSESLKRYMSIPGVRVVALCDVQPAKIDSAQATLRVNGRPAAAANLWETAAKLYGTETARGRSARQNAQAIARQSGR